MLQDIGQETFPDPSNNIANGWREIGLRISVTYYLKNGNLQKNELWKLWEDIINFYH